MMEMARKAAKYLSQACKNFLPAQGAKMEVGKSANELINNKLQIYEFVLQIQWSAPYGAENGGRPWSEPRKLDTTWEFTWVIV